MEFKSDFKTVELAAVDPDAPVNINFFYVYLFSRYFSTSISLRTKMLNTSREKKFQTIVQERKNSRLHQRK